MKTKKIKDERVIQLNNKIQSEAYIVVLFLMMVSIFIKSYVLNMNFLEYAVELGIIILSIAYVTLRSMWVGFDFMSDFKTGKTKVLSSILLISLAISIINGVSNYIIYGDKYTGIFDGLFLSVILITFISAMIFISFSFFILYFINMKGQQRIEKKIAEEDLLD